MQARCLRVLSVAADKSRYEEQPNRSAFTKVPTRRDQVQELPAPRDPATLLASSSSRHQLGVKRCSRCGEHVPVTDFYKDSSAKDGLTRWCKPCRKAYDAEWYIRTYKEVPRRAVRAPAHLKRCVSVLLRNSCMWPVPVHLIGHAQARGNGVLCCHKRPFQERCTILYHEHLNNCIWGSKPGRLPHQTKLT